ncbi:3-phosphoshikimate 1-carboxyvinyltransferase [Anaerovorax odorimutans]|uniref:3-phosphoshikimate 1-carboxyvinyltransferase n=1 Tax=Anaerovorax odorimutans TaxID=109327 RepID=A0ABT1RN34_9FIRM|nr:3-phosphoshikimate 1-carboxyvinyltransferase [Anaerovorax odorimutans]MCQ4636598.1 3-phosphoshikimate 1-carboxyvinyltransferase [Anaerovorax odorimutans]
MNIEIIPHTLVGSVNAVASKSHAHRLLIAAALSKRPPAISIGTTSRDIEATRTCLQQLRKEIPVLDCGESGSTLRFLLPVAMALKERAVFLGSGRLPQRPISPLKEEMEAHGCTFINKHRKKGEAREICEIRGRLQGGIFTLPGNISSQYITGLLYALPLLKENSRIQITTPLESRGYVDLTLDVLKKFRIQIYTAEKEGCPTYMIEGRQQYLPPGDMEAEGDWSNIAFWVIAGILSRDSGIICNGIDPQSIQGDRAILNLARRMGGKVTEKGHSILVMSDSLRSTHIDASAIPDLVPILAVAASTAKGVTHIHNAHRLRIKESDRLAAMYDCLSRVGANIKEEPGGLLIEGVPQLKGGTVSGYNDHRIVMAMTVASIVSDSPIIIEGAEAVNKSYPTFFEDFEALGGEYRVL